MLFRLFFKSLKSPGLFLNEKFKSNGSFDHVLMHLMTINIVINGIILTLCKKSIAYRNFYGKQWPNLGVLFLLSNN